MSTAEKEVLIANTSKRAIRHLKDNISTEDMTIDGTRSTALSGEKRTMYSLWRMTIIPCGQYRIGPEEKLINVPLSSARDTESAKHNGKG